MDGNTIHGYKASTIGNVSPLFCIECGADVNRDVEPITAEDLENFETASCALCEETFYTA